MDFALRLECSALSDINYETMNSGNTMTLSVNPIVEKCLAKMANDVTTQVRDKLIDIVIAVLTRECEDFDGEVVRRLIFAELESTPIAFAVEKHVAAASKNPKTKVVELDADGNPVKKVRTPSKEPKEKAPKAAPKPVLTEDEREARKAAKQAEKEAAKEARKAEKEAAKDADKEALKAAAKAEKEAAKEVRKAEKEATKEAAKAEKEAAKEAAKAEKEAAKLDKPVKEQRLPIPWCGKRIDGRCEALRAYHGLFAQCTADATEISAFCPSCEKSGAPFGTVTMRAACGIFDYTAPNGKKCVRLANVIDKFGFAEAGEQAFQEEAAKHNITIPYEHLEKEVKQRGRPKSVSPRASAAKIATSDSGSETETDDEEYQAKKQQQQQRKKVTKTAAAALAADAAPKKRGRPAKAKEAVAEPNDLLIQDLVASANKSSSVSATPTSTPRELEEELITPISSPAPAIAVAPAAPKKAIKPKAAPKVARKVVELDGDKFWEETFEGMELYVRCSDNIAFDRSNGNGVGTWDDKTKSVIEDNDSEDEE